MKLGVVLGSTRPGRVGPQVADWVVGIAGERGGLEVELVDVAAFDLPLFNESKPPVRAQRDYDHDATRAWSRTIDSFDGFVFVTAEHNHGIPAALKNSLDYLYPEWNNKAAGFVSYGTVGGVRSVEDLRSVMGILQIADVGMQVALLLEADFEDRSVFKPRDAQRARLDRMLDQLEPWMRAMKAVRNGD